MTEFLDRRGLVLRTDLLGAWAGWLTPVFEPRRYRTWFFVAALPAGQLTRDVSSESSTVAWLPALRGRRAGRGAATSLMLPPTYLTCLEIGQFADAGAVLAEAAGAHRGDVHAAVRWSAGRRLRAVHAADAASRWWRGPVSEPWAGGARRARPRACSHPTPSMMTLDGTNTWVLREPGAGRSVVVDPGPARPGPPRRGRGGRRRRRGGAADPPPPRPLRGGPGVRRADGLRRTRARPGVPARLGGPRRRRRGRASTGSRSASSRTPGHTADSLSFLLPARARRAHRRHRARPRHHGRRPPRRPTRRLPRLAGPAARARRAARVAAIWPATARSSRRARRPWTTTSPTGATARPGRGARSPLRAPSAGSRTRRPCRAGSSRSSTPTSTRSLWGAAELSVRAQLAYLAATRPPDPPGRRHNGRRRRPPAQRAQGGRQRSTNRPPPRRPTGLARSSRPRPAAARGARRSGGPASIRSTATP